MGWSFWVWEHSGSRPFDSDASSFPKRLRSRRWSDQLRQETAGRGSSAAGSGRGCVRNGIRKRLCCWKLSRCWKVRPRVSEMWTGNGHKAKWKYLFHYHPIRFLGKCPHLYKATCTSHRGWRNAPLKFNGQNKDGGTRVRVKSTVLHHCVPLKKWAEPEYARTNFQSSPPPIGNGSWKGAWPNRANLMICKSASYF